MGGVIVPFRGPISEALRALVGIRDDGGDSLEVKVCAVGELSLRDLECEAISGNGPGTDAASGDSSLVERLRLRVNIGLGWCMLAWISSVCGLVTPEIP